MVGASLKLHIANHELVSLWNVATIGLLGMEAKSLIGFVFFNDFCRAFFDTENVYGVSERCFTDALHQSADLSETANLTDEIINSEILLF